MQGTVPSSIYFVLYPNEKCSDFFCSPYLFSAKSTVTGVVYETGWGKSSRRFFNGIVLILCYFLKTERIRMRYFLDPNFPREWIGKCRCHFAVSFPWSCTNYVLLLEVKYKDFTLKYFPPLLLNLLEEYMLLQLQLQSSCLLKYKCDMCRATMCSHWTSVDWQM